MFIQCTLQCHILTLTQTFKNNHVVYSLTRLLPISYTNTYRMDIKRSAESIDIRHCKSAMLIFLFPIEVDVKKSELSLLS